MKGKGKIENKLEVYKKSLSHGKNNSTTNIDLIDMAKNCGMKLDILNKSDYKKLAQDKKEPKKVIVNMDEIGSGTHWVSFFTDENNIIHYYDSFGVFPPINIKGRLVFHNTSVDQLDDDTNCGYRALWFLLSKAE